MLVVMLDQCLVMRIVVKCWALGRLQVLRWAHFVGGGWLATVAAGLGSRE